MTRDEALLTLNDHSGQSVEVIVQVDQEDSTTAMVMSANGVLRHWRNEPHAAHAWAAHPREDITGLYGIGGASFDVTGLRDANLLSVDETLRGLAFKLADAVELTVVWGLE